MTAIPVPHYLTDQRFFTRMAVLVSVITIFGFAQFALRGIPDYRNAPFHIHLHGILYLGWLLLYMTQSVLAGRGSMRLHSKLGMAGAILVVMMVVVGSYAGIQSIARGHVPPHYTPAFFLPLVQLAVIAFGALAVTAIIMRRDTQTHRRLFFAAAVILMDPALDRMLPGPIIGGPTSQWLALAIQLTIMGIIMLHDRKQLGHVHGATWTGAAVIVATHLLTQSLAHVPAVAAMAGRIG